MSPANVFASLHRDAHFLVRNYLREHLTLWFGVGLLALARHVAPLPALRLEAHHLVFSLLAIPFGWWVASVIHNAGHANFSSPWRNRLMGEFAGLYLGYGFTNFILIHGLHHAHSDDEDDPVSPAGTTFFQYFTQPLRHPTARARRTLRKLHGHRPDAARTRLLEVLLFQANLVMRVAFFYLLFGPNLFLSFYVVSVVSDVAILAHINFACHRNHADGSVEVVNLSGNLYYRVANFVTRGGYFHKNHHLRPGLFDPRDFDGDARPMFTLPPSRNTLPEQAIRNRSWLQRLKQKLDVDGIWGEV